MAHYWDIPGFEGRYLEDSWVLKIRPGEGTLTISADLVLRESHPEYRDPRPGEQYCYRLGVIAFDDVTECSWTERGRMPATDASGEEDLGSFDQFEVEDASYLLAGDFGRIVVTSKPPTVSLSRPLRAERCEWSRHFLPGMSSPLLASCDQRRRTVRRRTRRGRDRRRAVIGTRYCGRWIVYGIPYSSRRSSTFGEAPTLSE